MDEEQSQPEPKISLPEAILIGLIFILFDAVGAVGGVTVIVNWIINLVASSIFIYLYMKGVPPIRQLITWLLELIPFLGILPLLTLGWALTVWADHHPSGVIAQAGAAAGAAKGKTRAARAGTKVGGRVAGGAAGPTAGVPKAARTISGAGEERRVVSRAPGEEARRAAPKEVGPQEPTAREIPGEKFGEAKEPIEEAKEKAFGYSPEEQLARERGERRKKREGEDLPKAA